MIDYELAKKLKEAGFPFVKFKKGITVHDNSTYKETREEWCGNCGNPLIEIDGIAFLQPTLEELIEACPELSVLIKSEDSWEAEILSESQQEISERRTPVLVRHVSKKTSGSTPQIAVANLFLALNEKKLDTKVP